MSISPTHAWMSVLYVVEFSSGVVKVGQTKNPETRYSALAGPLRPHGISITRKWHSQRHRNAPSNEKLLLEYCATKYGVLNGGDYFAGAGAEDVIAFAETLQGEAGDALRFESVGSTERSRLTLARIAQEVPGLVIVSASDSAV